VDYADVNLTRADRGVSDTREAASVRRDAVSAAPEDPLKLKELSVAEARLHRAEAHRTVLSLRRKLYALKLSSALDEVAFSKRARLSTLDLLDSEDRRSERSINSANLHAAGTEITDLALEARHLLRTRVSQLSELPSRALSVEGIWWLLKALILLAALIIGVRRLREKRQELVEALGRRVLTVRFWRLRQTKALRFVEVVGAILAPLTALLCVYAMLWLFQDDAPEIVVLSTIIKAALLYWLLVQVLRTLILPKWHRIGEQVPEDETEAARELEQDQFLLSTLQSLLTYTVVCQVTLYLVREGLGLLFVGYWIHVVGYLGYALVIYVLLSRWRDTIASLFAQRVGDRSPRAATFVNQHKDAVYGILVIFGAFSYVAVTSSARWARKYLDTFGTVRRIRNFVFRRRIEMEQRRGAAQPEAIDAAELPTSLVDAFNQRAPAVPALVRSEATTLRDIINDWDRPGRPGAVYVVGERGMGKTTLLEQLCGDLGDRALHWRVDEREYTEEVLVSRIGDLFGVDTRHLDTLTRELHNVPKRIVVIDDAHLLFLRCIGGFGAMQSLERIIVATGEHHLWVLAHDAWAWRFLRLRLRRPLDGPSVVTLSPWTALDLRQFTSGRTEGAGFDISFARLATEEGESTGDARSTGGYFSLLEEASHGNPWSAGSLWLGALSVENHTAHVGLFQSSKAAQLRTISDEARFLLAALVQHDGLTAENAAAVLGMNKFGAQELLLDLVERGYVERCDDGYIHRVKRSAYRDVVSFVRVHNLLHT
jgi:energy-coupling factor transporter ATP-binding protein EcfA2